MVREARDLERLADELAALTAEERQRVFRSLARKTPPPSNPHVPWEKLNRLIGMVHLGGNAVEDCERLYDG